MPLEPLEPEVPLVPDEPEEPEVPLVPDEPEEPEVPLDPDEPEVPLVPLLPDEPLEPDVPLDPLEPEVPLDPDVPEVPDEPDEPSPPLAPAKFMHQVPELVNVPTDSITVNTIAPDVELYESTVHSRYCVALKLSIILCAALYAKPAPIVKLRVAPIV